jgi:hypothetical protein
MRHQREARDEICAPSDTRTDKNRWCRGMMGRAHKPVWRPYVEQKHCTGLFRKEVRKWRVLVCVGCGKELKIDYGRVGRLN